MLKFATPDRRRRDRRAGGTRGGSRARDESWRRNFLASGSTPEKGRGMKKLAIVLVGIFVAAVAALPAAANGNGAQTFTSHIKNEPFTESDVVPCVEPELPAVITGTIKSGVEHFTLGPGAEIVGVDPDGVPIVEGSFHVTFTETGTFTAATAIGTFQGHFTFWGGFNSSAQNHIGTFTFAIQGTTPTGERFGASSVEHFNVSANEPPRANEFFKLVCRGSV